MDLSIETIAVITGIFYVIQFCVFYYQFITNKKYEGTGWWLLYSVSILFAFTIISYRGFFPGLGIPVVLQHILTIAGMLFLYIGFMKFSGNKVNYYFTAGILVLYLFLIMYFLFADNNARIRFGLINILLSSVCFFISFNIFRKRPKSTESAFIFVSVTTFLSATIFVLVAVLNFLSFRETDLFKIELSNVIQFLNILFASVFWTLGIVLMLNQRLKSELNESAEQFRHIFENSPDALLLIRTDNGIIVKANSIAEKMLGYSRSDIIGKTTSELKSWFNPEDRTRILDLVVEKKDISNVACILQDKSEKKINVLISAKEVTIDNINHTLAAVKDVSQLKDEEKKVQEINERFRISFDNANIGICIVGLDGRFIRTNRMMSKIFGYSEEEFLKMDVNTITHTDYLQVSPAYMKEAIEKKSDYSEFEKVYIHKNGSKITGLVSSSLIRDSEGNPLYFISHINDITNIKQSEELLKAEEEKYRLLAENATDAVWTMDVENQMFSYMSPSIQKISGYTAEESMRLPISAQLTQESTEIAYSEIARHIEEFKKGRDIFSTPYTYYLEQQHKGDGIIKPVEIIIRYFLNPKTNRLEMHGVTRDITDRKKAEDEIRRKNDELTKLNAEKDKFFSIIAHDLRSPFNGLLGLTQLMSNEPDTFTAKELKEISQSLNKSATNLYRLLNNLLEWSKMQRGITEFNPVPIKINNMVNETVNLFDEMAKQKGIIIEADLGNELETKADKFMLDTIIRNLVSNAVKFTSKGGRITIKTRKEGDNVKICVKDTGIGMPEGIIQNMFRLDKNISRQGTNEEAGTGLGLLLCKEYVDKHGGTLTVTSEEGKGSEFCFEI